MAGIFDGVRVIDFTAHVSGPACTSTLADLGAEVIKIEPPVTGEATRNLYPRLDGQALTYLWNNRGKKSVTINMKDPEGVAAIKELIKTADVLVENFRPGVMEKFGISYDRVKEFAPGIIYCSISAFGQYGPDAYRPGFDIVVQARSGIMDLTGEPDGMPTKIGIVLADMVSSKDAFAAIAAALYHKLKTGEGQYLDVSMLECVSSMNLYIDHALMGRDPQRQGRHHISLAPYGIFEGKNGQCIVLAAFTDKHWEILCNEVLKKPEMVDDPQYKTGNSRIENKLQIAAAIEDWLKTFDNIDDAVKTVEKFGLVASKINSTREVAQDPQLLAHGGIVDIEAMPSMKNTDSYKARGPWIKYSKTPAVMRRASELGEYNHEVLSGIGLSKEKIEEMESRWAKQK
ncbi:CaiB/BaiF CoA transferase family protein [Caproiciproducens sp. R1]|uniref:CaiB/BaiF CoA transferase family protein n=1 Tax=Caproiciproducens sp. R1 TaxID=3435000 RepID=UPI0040335453